MKLSTPAVLAPTILVLLLLIPATEAAIKCSDVVKALTPCVNYLKNGNGTPTSACCNGANKLNSLATTSSDRQTVCSCLKTAAQNINPNDAAAKALPGSCGITLPSPVSKTVDCSKIS
ncbi:non-specific lipid-transfer protein 1-like [Magnolia sinica]|uniref:non-specific lipid-transfer protein 1-like n=1 Tax=Magnolia sinica TaxID=86752 RepID=UPI0026582E15|nr:non-specific lipid-transfer protein 1-like [Magnolia sinica]